ncbi:MAG: hypothetical protein M1608_11250 [Candidatus Omnitrophica bacterium]|nr:hypothetical protein [Candidatus Omnitrophota bacterium]
MKRILNVSLAHSQNWGSPEFAPGMPFRLPAARTDQGDNGTTQFQQIKARLLKSALDSTREPALCRQLCLATNEAAALAWTTPCPLLVFPCLFEEKVAEAWNYFLRQRRILAATQPSAMAPLAKSCADNQPAYGKTFPAFMPANV